MIQAITPDRESALHNSNWTFDINGEQSWAKNSDCNSYIHGSFVLDFLIEEADEIIESAKFKVKAPKVRTLQQQLDFFELKLLKTNPVIIQHKDGRLSQGNAGEWLLQYILKVENWPNNHK